MRSYEDDRWFVYKDAQSNKMRSYVENLPDDWQWLWIMPQQRQNDVDDDKALYNWCVHNRVAWQGIPWASNVLEGRYHFDVNEMSMIAKQWEPDVLLCEVPEHVRAWRAVQRRIGREFPIVAMVEHVDIYEQTRVPDRVSYFLRQFDGYLAADKMAFPLEGMEREWVKHVADLLPEDAVVSFFHPEIGDDKLRVWDAIYSGLEVDKAETTESHFIPRIYFISRLSDNQRTHYEEFFEACRILANEQWKFELWVADPNEANREYGDLQANLGLNHHITHWGTRTRSDYLERLWRADIVPVLYPQDIIYSLGFCEAIMAGNLVVTTKGLQGQQVLPGVNEPSHDMVTPKAVAASLRSALELSEGRRNNLMVRQQDWLERHRSVEQNIHRVYETIEEVTGVRAR